MTNILGISCYYHDSAASLIIDGKIKYALQEERFSRIKHDSSFPKNSIQSILKSMKISLQDIDHIVFYDKPLITFERIIETSLILAPRGFSQFRKSIPVWLKDKLFLKKNIIRELQGIDSLFNKREILFSEHHLSHAASAFYPSPFENAAILTIDGVGEWATTTLSIGNKNKIDILKEINFPHSLGLLYSAFTYYLGFKVNSGEYKVMGLAPYGVPKYFDLILDKLVSVKDDGSFRLNQNFFGYLDGLTMTNENFSNLFGKKPRLSENELLTQFHMDIASSLQKVTEHIILTMTRSIYKNYKYRNLCLAGGVALNCVANGKILKDKNNFNNIWIQPASGDAGGSIGAALAFYHNELNKKRNIIYPDSMQGSYLGISYNNDQIFDELSSIGAKFRKLDDQELLKKTANDLSKGKSIGWFQGRMEFGPRALGARSILGDPRDEKMQKKLNLKIKYRESFRPFAPSVLEEDVDKYFEFNKLSPYMLFCGNVVKKRRKFNKNKNNLFGIDLLNLVRSDVPAITHVDYSARIQTVSKETNLKFYKLISEFKKITNVGMLVNTSFNVRGEPIVNTPTDAFKCFMGTELDVLVLENFYLKKSEQNKSLKIDYSTKFNPD